MRLVALAASLTLALGASGAAAQEAALAPEAEAARAALWRHAVEGLVRQEGRLLIQLPGSDPAEYGGAQARSLLREFLGLGVEVETSIRAARELEPGVGFVELSRRYRSPQTQVLTRETILLGYQRRGEGWELTELRILR